MQFGPQDTGYTHHSTEFRGCVEDGGGGYDYERLVILTELGEDWFEMRYIEYFTNATSCGFPRVSVDTCRAERTLGCALVR